MLVVCVVVIIIIQYIYSVPITIGAKPTGATGHLPHTGENISLCPGIFWSIIYWQLAIDRNYFLPFLLVVACVLVIK